jgi:hypothetical protein
MGPPIAPRLAGRRLQAVAAALRAPVAGRAIAAVAIRQMGLAWLRATDVPDRDTRPVIAFRAAPRPPEDGRGG